MKRRLWVLLFVVVMAMVALCASAVAADDPLRVAMQMSATSFTEPATVTIQIQVSNTGEADMPGAVTLYAPDGSQIEDFGSPTLAVGASKTWEGTWDVTEEELLAGKLTFKLRYPAYNESGELVNRTRSFSKAITYEGAVTAVEINRKITPTVAEKGKEVQVIYEVINTGTVDVSDVVITENKSISSKTGKIAKVAAGEKESYTFKVTMGQKDLTSEGKITYRANGSSQTVTKEAQTIRYGEMHLSASLKADRKGGAVGEAVALTLTLKNSGKTDYTDIVVTDSALGEIYNGLTVAAGKTETYKTNLLMNGTGSYQFSVAATDSKGNRVETATDAVTLVTISDADAITLEVSATADRSTVYELPGVVKFQVSVTNRSMSDVSDVSVSASGVSLYTFPTILAGETREFTRDVSVSMQGQYQFQASVENKLGEKQHFASNILQIGFAAPTAEPTAAPIVTPPVPQLLEIPTTPEGYEAALQTKGVMYAVYQVSFVLMLLGGLLLLSAVGVRVARKVNGEKRERLDLPVYRDYEKPNDEQVAEQTETEASAQDASTEEEQ